RVAIARALINDPEIIIADEPTGALDSTTSMQILQILKQIADSGKLVIMVTHSEKVAKISSRVVEISDGRIVSDKLNENYKKHEDLQTDGKSISQEVPSDEVVDLNKLVLDQNKEIKSKSEKRKKKNSKENQNLSLWSAIRLSLHNMWASRIKNFLMAFGVAIGIGSLILMMCFSSGITDYINKTMKSYSDPTIVTITKKGTANDMASMMSYKSFSPTEIADLEKELKKELALNEDDHETLKFSYGVQMMTMFSYAKVIYNPDNLHFSYFDPDLLDQNKLNEEQKKENGEAYSEFNYTNVVYMYTTPPYYTEQNIVEGEMSTSEGGIMFSSGIKKLFEDNSIFNEDGSNKTVDVAFEYVGENGKSQITFHDQEITGIVDTSVMANFLVMYIDYDYFQTLFKTENSGKALDPNALFIKTDSEETTDKINAYLAENHPEYSGSVEDQLAGMFTSMSSIIGTSLIVISGISLIVSAMMILVVLYMSVTERTKEIGVLKSIGARRKDIKRIFTSESLLIGVLSGIFGILFSLLEALIIWLLLSNLIGLAPISFRWWYFVIAMGVSIIISMLSGLYPASKAAKLDPVESLRRE
ncbi:MAG: FtsX-like permease family protein, partial [Clostridia bacterium]|nr:FtsX-like permease family protein [Clostridia bacterium]